MKKIFFQFLAFFFCAQIFCAELPFPFFEFMLSNGMCVFVCEDFSSPIVKVEYATKSPSFQNQNEETLFSICAQLFKEAGNYAKQKNETYFLNEAHEEITSQNARYFFNVLDSELEPLFEQIALCAFCPIFEDAILQKKIDELKDEQNFAKDFVNCEINARIFENNSSVQNDVFQNEKNDFIKNLSVSDFRIMLLQCAKKYFSPQTSAIFVSGAVNAKAVSNIANKIFGAYAPHPQSAATLPNLFQNAESKTTSTNQNKKIVLAHKNFSPDLAQIVMQFFLPSIEDAQIAAAILNQKNFSSGTLGGQFADAAAAQKNGKHRLIVQAILQDEQNFYFEKCASFEKKLKTEIENFSKDDFEIAKKNLVYEFENSISNSSLFMNAFSKFWANENSATENVAILLENFLLYPQKIQNANYEKLKSALQNQTPYFFVLLNENIFALQNNLFKKSYEIATQKNLSSKNDSPPPAQDSLSQSDIEIYNKKFAAQNKTSIKAALLSNEIRATLKTTNSMGRAAVALYIDGGELFSAKTQFGMEALLIHILEANVKKEKQEAIENGALSKPFLTQTFINDTNTLIVADCATEDAKTVIACFSRALFRNFSAAEVDIALKKIRTRQIVKTGALSFQLYAGAAKIFYPAYAALFNSKKEILQGLKYSDVQNAFKKMQDSNRIEILVAANFSQNEENAFLLESERAFGKLQPLSKISSPYSSPKRPPKYALRIQLEHTFLSDVGADKAGPRPAILVPTKDFTDPAQYWLKAPVAADKNRAIFDALFFELESICKKNAKVAVEENRVLISFGAMTFFDVKKTSKTDELFKNAILELEQNIFNEKSLSAIKAQWIKRRFENAEENIQTLLKLAHEIEKARLFPSKKFSAQKMIANDYETVALCEKEKFLEVYEKYFSRPFFKVCSASSR